MFNWMLSRLLNPIRVAHGSLDTQKDEAKKSDSQINEAKKSDSQIN